MALVDFTNPDAVAWYPAKLQGAAGQGRRLLQDRLRRADPDRRRLARRLRPAADAQLLHAPLQPGGLRAARGRARRGRGRAVRPVGDRGRPAVPGALGRRLRVDVRRRWPSRCAAGCRWRRPGFGYWSHDIGGFEGTPGPGRVQALARVRAALVAPPAARLRLVPGAVGVRRGGRRRRAARSPGSSCALMPYLAAARPRRRTATGVPMMRPMVLEFPDDPAAAYLDRQYMLGPDAAGRSGVHRRRRGDVLRPGGHLDAPAHRRPGHRPGLGHRAARLRRVPVLVRPGSVHPVGARRRPAGLRVGRRRHAAAASPRSRASATRVPGARSARAARRCAEFEVDATVIGAAVADAALRRGDVVVGSAASRSDREEAH